MRKLLFTLFLICGFIAPQQVSSQEKEDVHNYFVLTRKLEQLRAIYFTAGDLSEMDGMSYGEFKVIIFGQAVKEFSKNEELEEILLKAEEKGIELIVCGFSLKKFGISPESFPENIQVVKNGIALGFNLQKEGYHSITL
ncbi:MAG: DsrE family protein [Bacteroidota bacterium]|nr:DsrE family protein [Bacteroidota bacterium]